MFWKNTRMIAGICLFAIGMGMQCWAEENTASPNAAPQNAMADKTGIKNDLDNVHLDRLEITKRRNNRSRVSGQIVNDSQQVIGYAKLAMLFYGKDGNLVLDDDRVLFDQLGGSSPISKALDPGYARKFNFEIRPAADGFQSAVIKLKNISPGLKEESVLTVEPKLGSGFGWPYGISGENFELLFGDLVAVGIGAGNAALLYGYPITAWQVMGRFYYGDPDFSLRGRLGLGYGTAKIIDASMNGLHKIETVTGFHPSAGLQWRIFQNVSLDLDVEYVIPSESSRSYKYTSTYWWWDYNSRQYHAETRAETYTVALAPYVSGAFGITVHFGNHNVTEDTLSQKQIH